jgi:hypothetical protein
MNRGGGPGSSFRAAPVNCLSGPEWCKNAEYYVVRAVTGRALNPNNGR